MLSIVILVVSFIFIGLFFLLLVKFILGIKDNKFIYKSSLKTIKSFSFSMVILLFFYAISFGFVFGGFTSMITYKNSIKDNHDNYNTHLFSLNPNKGYYGDWNSRKYLTKEYWEMFVDAPYPTYELPWFPGVEFGPKWSEFMSEIYKESPLADTLDPISHTYKPLNTFYSKGVIFNLDVWKMIANSYDYYSSLYDENNDLYYRLVQSFQVTAKLQSSEEIIKNIRTLYFVNLEDYNYSNNSFYTSFDKMFRDDSFTQKTSSKKGENYYLARYEFTEFAKKRVGNGYYTKEDLLSINNHHKNKPITDDKVIEVAVSDYFAEKNNISLGQEYKVSLYKKYNNKITYSFMPIATYRDSYSSGDDEWTGSILINSLDYNRLVYGEDPELTNYSPRFTRREEVILQTKSMIDSFSIRQQVSKKQYETLLEGELAQRVNLFNQYIFQSIFPGKKFEELKLKDQQNFLNYFMIRLDVASAYNKTSNSYYSRNDNGSLNYYITEIINIVIIILLFIIVITILFSIINSKIKDNYKQFGVLKSFGYSTNSISLSFLMFPIILMLVNNVFALSFSVLFYWLSMRNYKNLFNVVVRPPSIIALIFIFLLSFSIIIVFSYLKIRKSLAKKETILLEGKSVYNPNIIFRKMSKIGDKFKSFEVSYAFKNIFKSISKSSLIVFSTLSSLFLVAISFTISSFVSINTSENFSGANFDNYDYYSFREWNRYANFSSPRKYFKKIDGLDEAFRERYTNLNFEAIDKILDEEFLLGEYNLSLLDTNVDFSSTYKNEYKRISLEITNYLSSNYVVKRNDVVKKDVIDNYELFDYSYISPQTTWNFFEIYAKLAFLYKKDHPFATWDNFDKGFYQETDKGVIQNENLTLMRMYKFIFLSPTYKWISNNYMDLLEIDLNDEPLIALKDFYLRTFPYITFGKTLFDSEKAAFFFHSSLGVSKTSNISLDDKNLFKTVNVSFIDSYKEYERWMNIKFKSGPNITERFASETPNKEYIPVVIDKGIARNQKVEQGDFLYIKNFDRFNNPDFIKIKIIGIYSKIDYGILTSREFVEGYTQKATSFHYVFYNDAFQIDNQSSYGFSESSYEKMLKFFKPDEGIELLSESSEESSSVFKNNLIADLKVTYNLPFLKALSNQVNKIITESLILSSLIILIIPMFMILISIKETIDDNVREVSMLKSLGYNTRQTSKLILSPNLLLVFTALVVLIPLVFLMFFLFTKLFLFLMAADLTFKMVWWQWLAIIGLDLIIMALLYSVSFYFYYKLNSKEVIKNIF